MKKKEVLTVLCNGAGQDTSYLIHRLATDEEFYNKWVVGPLPIVGADTGDEHKHTYKNIERLRKLAEKNNIPFYWITPEMGFHSRTWQSLTGQYRRNNTIGSAAFIQTCTDKLKVKVVDRFVERWIADNYYGGQLRSRKQTYRDFYRDYGKIRLLLGFAKGEEDRTTGADRHDQVWKKMVVNRHYPLIQEGIDRQAAIDYNEEHFRHRIFPSNCKRCFFMSLQELLWLYRNCPDDFYEWVGLEAAKIENNRHKAEKNLYVFGKISLTERLAIAEQRYGHWTDQQLNEYKYSHGHCIKTKY